ncbi:MAG: hypothetical protein ABI586_09810, partial [Candidatus Nanopelagicales bacterium]
MLRREFLYSSLGWTAATLFGPGLKLGQSLALEASTTLPLVQARMSDALCQSYLINTKIFFNKSAYAHTDAVMDLLKRLGVRGVREKMTVGRSVGTQMQKYAMPLLAEAGIRWHGTVAEVADWEQATFANKEVMDLLTSYYYPRMGNDLSTLMHSFGGCNEVDNRRNGSEWATHARVMQQALWDQAKANPTTRNIPVAGPSTRTDVTATRAADLGDLSAMCDMGNGHLYNKGTSPTREIDEHLGVLRPVFPHVADWIMTETGYNNSPQDNLGKTIPEFASATYAPRAVCDFFTRNTAYCRFELMDDPNAIDYTSQTTINNTSVRDAHFGLVAMTKTTVGESTPDTWREKPEFQTMARFMGLLADRGSVFTPDGLNVQVSGGGSDLQQLLLQKRDGRHYLILWRDVAVATFYPDAKP